MQVIEYGSYTAASRAVGVPKSTISQRIAALERTVGTGLLRHMSRSFSLAEAGSMLLLYTRAMDDLARRIEQELLEQGPEITGTLRVLCSIVIGQFALAHLMPKFLALHPRASVRVESSDRLVDLVGEGFDMAVRGHIGPLRDSTLLCSPQPDERRPRPVRSRSQCRVPGTPIGTIEPAAKRMRVAECGVRDPRIGNGKYQLVQPIPPPTRLRRLAVFNSAEAVTQLTRTAIVGP